MYIDKKMIYFYLPNDDVLNIETYSEAPIYCFQHYFTVRRKFIPNYICPLIQYWANDMSLS